MRIVAEDDGERQIDLLLIDVDGERFGNDSGLGEFGVLAVNGIDRQDDLEQG